MNLYIIFPLTILPIYLNKNKRKNKFVLKKICTVVTYISYLISQCEYALIFVFYSYPHKDISIFFLLALAVGDSGTENFKETKKKQIFGATARNGFWFRKIFWKQFSFITPKRRYKNKDFKSVQQKNEKNTEKNPKPKTFGTDWSNSTSFPITKRKIFLGDFY